MFAILDPRPRCGPLGDSWIWRLVDSLEAVPAAALRMPGIVIAGSVCIQVLRRLALGYWEPPHCYCGERHSEHRAAMGRSRCRMIRRDCDVMSTR